MKLDKRIIMLTAIIIGTILLLSNFTPVQGKNSVYQILSDYQDYPNGGNGYLRIMNFDTLNNQIEVTTFSPYLNQYKSGSASNFNLSYTLNNLPNGSMAPISAPFTIIVLPDTQYYSKSYPQIFINQTTWIVQNKQNLNIQFVIHLGDLVDTYNNITQWTNAYTAMNILRQNSIPFSMLAGNHDYVIWESAKNQSSYYTYSTLLGYTTQPSFGGSLNNDNFNSYSTFNIGYDKYLILSLEWSPSSTDLNWANQIIQQHPNTKVILATHEYLGTGGRTPVGDTIWNTVVRPNAEQCQIVLCGHNNGEGVIPNSLFGINQDEILKVDKA